MKTSKIFITLLSAALLLAGCSKEHIDFNKGEGKDENVGYLVLSGMNVNVNADSENNTDTGEVKNATRTAQSRATVEASDDYIVTIVNSSTREEVLRETYGAIRRRTEPIALAPGQYNITAKSPDADNMPAADFECPAYSGSVTATVIKKTQTPAPTIVCKLANIKTSIYFSDLLKSSFDLTSTDNPLQATVALGDNSLTFGHTETRRGFFRPIQTINQLVVTLTGNYNTAPEGSAPVYKPVRMTQTIDNVRAGQWRQIRFAIHVSTEGNVIFSVQVDTWVDDEPIDVDVMSTTYDFAEEVIPDEEVSDPDAPVASLDNHHDIAEPFVISSGSFDDEGFCTDRIMLLFTPQSGSTVEKVTATIRSDNEQLLAAVDALGLTDNRFDLTDVLTIDGAAYTTVSGTAPKAIRATQAAMKKLYEFAGTHVVRLAATDSQNRTSYTDLTLTVRRSGGSDAGPVIEWRGRDIDTRYVANDVEECIIDIHSTTGITNFLVDIKGGNILSDEELVLLGLAPHMDLIRPADDKMDAMLNNLGFKTKDAVQGAKELSFDISQFMPMMVALGQSGPVDFQLTVTDSEGTVVKTVMLTVRQDQ